MSRRLSRSLALLGLVALLALTPQAALALPGSDPGAPLGTNYCDSTVDLTLFASDFESGDLAAEGWTVHNDVTAVEEGAYRSSLGARIRPRSHIRAAVSTAGASRVRFDYAWRTRQMTAPHRLWVEWWDGARWQTLERGRGFDWTERSIEPPPEAGGNPDFEVRFRHRGPHPYGRAHVDNVRLTQLTGHLEAFGSASVADNDLTLVATGLPTRSVGLFLFGTSQAQVPMGNGLLCVGGTRTRLMPPVHTGLQGVATRAVDLSVEPALSAIAQAAPITIHFQLWHREHGNASNLSDALTIPFGL